MAKAPNPGTSTAITSVYVVRPKPARESGARGRATGSRARTGEFKAGELVPGTRYRVLGLLGVGGMGSVYEVEHTELGKRFVLKALLSELAQRDDLVARVRNEQRALGRLEHPCIVAVTDAGTTSFDVPYFVMERLEGETLSARLKRGGCLSIDDALAVAVGVLEGLAAAHHIGVIHRDVKPQNIFIATGLRPKILDFGVAKVADASCTITARGVAVGTPRYMSPEQASGEAVDGRSDIYAVGLVLYECLLGRGPFDNVRDANEMLLAHLSRPIPRLLGRVGGMTEELDALLATLLAKSPDARPPTAASAAAALQAARAQSARAPALLPPFTVRLAPNPSAAPQPTTRLDGIAGRRGARGAGITEDAPTLPRAAMPVASATERIVTTAAPPSRGSTRTEVLPAFVSFEPPGSDVVTRTRVPVTPVESSCTVPPSPGRPSLSRALARNRTFVWLTAGVVGLSLGVWSRWSAAPRSRQAPSLAARPVLTPPSVPARSVELARGPASAAPAPPPVLVAPPIPQKQPALAPNLARPAKKTEKKVRGPTRAPGLPSSGL